MVESLKIMKSRNDAVHKIVVSVMNEAIPQEGQLVNPFKAKRKSSKQISLDDMLTRKAPTELPKNIEEWTSKHFATYFARSYQSATGGNYKITFTSDLPVIKQIGDFFERNGLPRNLWTKKFFDWAIANQEQIVRKFGYLTLNSVFNSVNYFYQDEVLPGVEQGEVIRTSNDTSLLQEIKEAQAAGKATEVFARFGIPVTITYLCKIQNIEEEKILSILENRLESLSVGPTADPTTMERIFNSSIINSPYPAEFSCLNWRNKFDKYAKFFHTETWWRNEDYKGQPLEKYYTLLGGN